MKRRVEEEWPLSNDTVAARAAARAVSIDGGGRLGYRLGLRVGEDGVDGEDGEEGIHLC